MTKTAKVSRWDKPEVGAIKRLRDGPRIDEEHKKDGL